MTPWELTRLRAFEFEVPFNKFLSKNYRYAKRFAKVISGAHRIAREEVAHYCSAAMKKAGIRGLPKTHIFLDLTIYKPSHRFDAHNFIDDFFDAVEPVLGQNDNTYHVACRWQIDKTKPRIECEVFVNSWEQQLYCRKCGNLRSAKYPCAYCAALEPKEGLHATS